MKIREHRQENGNVGATKSNKKAPAAHALEPYLSIENFFIDRYLPTSTCQDEQESARSNAWPAGILNVCESGLDR